MAENFVTKTYLQKQFEGYSEVLKEKFALKDEAGILTEPLTATTSIGSVSSGKTYEKNTKLEDIIRDILTTYQKAGLAVSLDPSTELYDIVSDTLSSIVVSAATTKGTNEITSVTFYVDGIEVNETTNGVANGGTFKYTHNFVTPQNKTFSVRVEVFDGKQTTSQTKTVTFVPRSYYGTVAKTVVTPTETDIKGLVDTVLKNTQKFTWENIDCQDSKLLYAYPKQFSALTSIKDGMDFPYLDSYTETIVEVDGYEYRCYLLNIEMTCDADEGFKQVFA